MPGPVRVEGSVPDPVIAVSRADATPTGQPANAIVLGYGAQSVTLTASDATAGSSSGFAWNPGDGLNSTNGASTQFVPAAAGSYAFRVQAVNQNGCRAESSVTIPVIDARCKGNKVLVCKATGSGTSHEICVSDSTEPLGELLRPRQADEGNARGGKGAPQGAQSWHGAQHVAQLERTENHSLSKWRDCTFLSLPGRISSSPGGANNRHGLAV